MPDEQVQDLTINETMNLLAEDDKPEESKDTLLESEEIKDEEVEGEESEDEEDEEIQLTEDETEDEEVDEEKLELVVPVRRKEILAKYPKLFKEFPYLEKAYYREQQFTEIVPTIQEARQAVQKAESLDQFENYIKSGKTEAILKVVKNNDPEAFNRLADDYLGTLARVDKDAYHHVLGNVVKETISSMVQEGRASNNEDLKRAAQILHQFVFGSSEWKPPGKLASEVRADPKEEEFNKKQQEFSRQQYQTAQDDLNQKVDNVLKNTIKKFLDPKESMTDYVRKTASREVLENLQGIIQADKRFKVIIDNLWKNAHNNNYSQTSLDKIRTAYLSRAQTVLPSVIKKARSEALKGLGKRVKEDSEESPEPESRKKGPAPVGRTASSPISGKNDKEKAKSIPVGMSTREFLMSD